VKEMSRDEAYKVYETLLRALHTLISLGKGDDNEADQIREAMDRSWRYLTDEDREKFEELSGDLNDKRRRREWMKKYICNEMFVCGVIGGIMWGIAIALAYMII